MTLIRNLWKFPSFEGLSGTSGYIFDYSGNDGGHELSIDWKTSGSQSVHWWGSAGSNNTEARYLRMPDNNIHRPEIEPSTEYTFSVDINALDVPDKPITFTIYWYQGTSSRGLYEDQVALSPGVGRYSLTATSPSDATYARVQLGWGASSAHRLQDETWDFYIDSVRFSEGTKTDYFDGSGYTDPDTGLWTPDPLHERVAWEGEEHASPSVMYVSSAMYSAPTGLWITGIWKPY